MIRLLTTFAVIVSKGKAMTAVPFKNNEYNYDVFSENLSCSSDKCAKSLSFRLFSFFFFGVF